MLEAQSHLSPYFVTLTYEKEPDGRNLRKDQLSAALHRLRTNLARRDGSRLRFYACGEYGDQGGRPHYHLALFGLSPWDKEVDSQRPGRFTSAAIRAIWAIDHGPGNGVGGACDVGDLTPQAAEYITGYVTKKLTKPNDPRLDGRSPEFALMSRRPGIGTGSLATIIEALNTSHGALYLARHKDVPAAFMVGTKMMPMGTYFRRLLRLHFFGEANQPDAAKDLNNRKFYENIQAHLPPLQVDSSFAQKMEAWYEAQAESRDAYHASLRQKKLKLEKKHQLKKSKETL